MIFGGGIFTLAAFLLFAYCVFDVIRTDESTVQNLPKMLWLIIVVFVPLIGPLAWLLLGRPAGASFELRDAGQPRQRRLPPPPPPTGRPELPPISPADHEARREEALRRYMAEREEQLRRREEEVRRLEDELRRRELGETDEG